MRPPNVNSDIGKTSLLYTLLLTSVCILMTTILCAKKRTTPKRVPSNERIGKSLERKSSREHKEITARSDVWDDYDKKLEKSKNVESKKTQSSEERLSKQQISAEAAPKKKVEEKTKQQTQATAETPFDYSEALKRPPPDVDLNDFVVRAAMAQTVVNPFLVKKIGNIDDEHADPKKLKEHIQQLDEQMKTKEATVEDRPEQAKVKGVKWGDAKSVLYETRDQLTLEDEAEDAGDLA